jgi:hypothetical protein
MRHIQLMATVFYPAGEQKVRMESFD